LGRSKSHKLKWILEKMNKLKVKIKGIVRFKELKIISLRLKSFLKLFLDWLKSFSYTSKFPVRSDHTVWLVNEQNFTLSL